MSERPSDPPPPIRVVVSDDHPVVRQGLRSFLESRGFAVVGEAGDGAEAVRLVRETGPDVLLTDLVMPGVDGIEAIRRLRADGTPVGILVLTSFSGAEQVIPAIRAGADGYLLKDAGPGALEDAIRAVHRGEPMLAPEAAAVVMARVAGEPALDPDTDVATGRGDAPGAGTAGPPAEHPDLARLTAREREVLAGLGRGLSNRELAADLFVSEKTIKTHVSSVLAKLRLHDRTQAALFAVRVGIADPRR
jgi:DNA-binding NarL/FixJ family response regulator